MDLNIKIPKRFKEQLEKRFDIKLFKVGEVFVNSTECALCEEFKGRCKGCCFYAFKDGGTPGCCIWMKKIIPDVLDMLCIVAGGILFDKKHLKEIKADLLVLKKAADKYIEWV